LIPIPTRFTSELLIVWKYLGIMFLKYFKISLTKTEVMAFKGKDPVRSKILINGNILK
jgi:hypothetical protein